MADDDFNAAAGAAAPPPPPRKDDGFSIEDAGDDPPPRPPGKGGKGRRQRRQENYAELARRPAVWRCPQGIAYVSVPYPRHVEHMPVRSPDFKRWLKLTYHLENGPEAILPNNVATELVELTEARALVSGDERRTWRRVAFHEGAHWLDLGGADPSGERRAVRTTKQGWAIVEPDAVPVMFLRGADAMPLPEPEANAASWPDICGFVNVASEDDAELIWGALLCTARAFLEGGSYPILVISGEQGSGKTLAARFLHALLDESATTGRGMPRDVRDQFVGAQHRHIQSYDNLSDINGESADATCRISTGGAYVGRTLHTDSDETVLSALKPQFLNGIPSTLLSRPDLADRAISIELRRIEARRTEAEIIAQFQRMRPALLGLLLDGISAGLRNIETTQIEGEGIRMRDALLWAEACAPGVGIEPGRIAAAWAANRQAANRTALELDEVAGAVLALLDERQAADGVAEWRGSPSELFNRLCGIVPERASRSMAWPKNPAGMSTRLKRLAPVLRSVRGVEIVSSKGGADSARFWTLRRAP